MTKITVKKIKNVGSIFLVAIFVTQPPRPPLLQSSQDPRWVMKIAPKIENVGLIFLVAILITQLPTSPLQSQSSQDPGWVTKIMPKESKTSV